MIHYFDRSRMETDHKCPRRLYWEYYFDGRGLQPVKLNQHQAFGSAVHETLADILMYGDIPPMAWVANSIKAAAALMRLKFTQAKGFQIQATTEMNFEGEMIQVTDDQTWLVDHYCDLLEGLTIGWCLVRLPQLLQQYRVVQVETEERLVITGDNTNVDQLMFLSRPDAILERRTDGALVILSLKTTSDPNQMWLENFKTDQQTISEVLPVESRLGREVAGVQVEGLVKGQQRTEWPKGSGNKHHSSPLVWGYRKEEGGLADEWKAQFEWKDEAGNNRRLGKGWNRNRVAESYPGGIPEWVSFLYQAEPDLLRSQFPSLPLISRSANELEEWQTQVKYREIEVANALVQLRLGDQSYNPEIRQQVLAQAFPKHTTGCAYDPQFHSKCPCYPLCWGSEGQDPLGCGSYKYREANHPERELDVRP